MDSDELSFLEPNFDLNKLTKPQLRGLISVHSPEHLPPVAAKKDDLIEVIKEHILPRSKQILSARKKIKPSSAGITFLDEQSRPSPLKQSSSLVQSPEAADTGKKTRGTRSRSRSSSPRPSPTKTTRSRRKTTEETATPVKSEPYSPLSSLKSIMPSYQDTPKTATQKLSARFAEISSANGTLPAKSNTRSKEGTQEGMQMEEKLYVDWTIVGQWLRESILVFGCLTLTVSIALFVRWKYIHPFPYCPADLSESPRPLTDIFFSPADTFTILNTYCLPCPRHGRCVNGRLNCLDGFVKRSNWGFGAQCIPDRKQLALVESTGKAIMSILSETAGKAICEGGIKWMSEADLKATLQSQQEISKFDHIFKLAVDDLLKEGSELRVRRSQEQDGERLFESMKPKLPLSCRLRLSLIDFFDTHKQAIFTIILLIVTIIMTIQKYRQYLYSKSRSSELIDSVFQLLAEQAAIHRRDPLTPSTVIVDQLRDALFLKNPGDAYLWPRVCVAVTANSNVREQSIQHHGQYSMSWEWIGMDILGGSGVRPSPPRPVHTNIQSHIQSSQQHTAVKRPSSGGGGLYPSLNL